MKHTILLLPVLAAAVLGSGCVAIPMGTETFTTEYPADIRPTDDPPVKNYEPKLDVFQNDESRSSVQLGLKGVVTAIQKQERRYESVSLDKQKRIAFGFFPGNAAEDFGSKNKLQPMRDPYVGNGRYMSGTNGKGGGDDGFALGNCLGFGTLGILPTLYSIFIEPFAPYEKKNHFLGPRLDRQFEVRTATYQKVSETYSSREIDLLLKFPMEEREKIGAWTYHENDTHPHNTFQFAFLNSWFGFYKYCDYIVHDPQETDKTTPADPKTTVSSRTVFGPFSVMLTLPDHAYSETVEVDTSLATADFRLGDAANGDSFANGTVRFLPPPGGLAAVRNEDDRAILELAMEREWPVTVALPAPRLGKVEQPGAGGTARPTNAPYQIASIGRTDDGKGLVVRVTVNDTSKTFEIDRAVQPEVRRMFREQFATGENAGRRETIRMEVPDGGKTLVYTATFE